MTTATLDPETLASMTEAAFELRNALTDMERDLSDLDDRIDELRRCRDSLLDQHGYALGAFDTLSHLCGDRPTTLDALRAHLKDHPNVTYTTWEPGNVPLSLEFVEYRDRMLHFRGAHVPDLAKRFNADRVYFRPDGFRMLDYGSKAHIFIYSD